MATGVRRLRFSDAVERQYEADTRADRTRHLVIVSLIGIVIYDIFLISDWQMVGDVFRQALIWRVGIYTPLAFVAVFIVSRSRSRFVREGLAAVVGVLCGIPMLILFSISNSPIKVTYHYGLLIVVMFVTVVQRVQFRYAVASVSGILAVQFFVVSQSAVFTPAMLQAEVTFFVSTAMLILVAAYMLEREMRRGYLLVKRGHLLNEQLDHAAKIDPLTGLWNRRHLNATMETAWTEARTAPNSMAVILLDIDHFKLFNDTIGHLAGDRCLQWIGSVLLAAQEEIGGAAFRFGGEEFLVFLPGFEAEAAFGVAERLRRAIVQDAIPHGAFGAGPIVTASFGVASGRAPDMSASALVAAADEALYAAKRAGRNCVSGSAESAGPEAMIAVAA